MSTYESAHLRQARPDGEDRTLTYHVGHGLQKLKELGRTYTALTRDTSRLKSRLKAVYRKLQAA